MRCTILPAVGAAFTPAVAWLPLSGTRFGSSSMTSTRYSGASVGKAAMKEVSSEEPS